MLRKIRKSEGFFLGELLLSLSIWLLAIGVLLPFVMKVSYQSMKVRMETGAIHLLYEEVQAKIADGQVLGNRAVNRYGYEYDIIWKTDREVCVKFEERFQHPVEKCETIE
ncbi:hypothetical protein C0971_12310 [Bacillus methanolicus]|uniref:hypothetical protein n=1 Tax=Bacillus methanolicus TaxID=1471 RepID=UPI00200C0BB4|nr:hypothetical protein [Bacillus methanolicus]UQD52726.1 hypothetical protein C0971_12310 [Bacillus methanolicus]